MFTGIIESIGTVVAVSSSPLGRRLVLDVGDMIQDMAVGDSLAVNGVCLTATTVSSPELTADVVAETLSRSNLGDLVAGDRVNLERPLRVDGRLDGHIVQGHVDATGEVLEVGGDGESTTVTIGVQDGYKRYLVEKGSVTVDGVSLTLAAIKPNGFSVALIPHTLSVTTLGLRRPGDLVNLEFDVLAKYVERLMGTRQ